METSKKVLSIYGDNMHGKKLYQKRARKALPILVRQAGTRQKIYYSHLAEELDMHWRPLLRSLGSIGNTLEEIGKSWKEKIPPIQCLVVDKKDELPGDGISRFIDEFINDETEFRKLNKKEKHIRVNWVLEKVSAYERWDSVLKELGLEPALIPESVIQEVKKSALSRRGSGGEGIEHKKLKQYIANNPQSVGIGARKWETETEKDLPSGDFIDVSFESKRRWIGVEVKSKISDEGDIQRGLYQCVKYHAVMKAYSSVQPLQKDVEVILALGCKLPKRLIPVRNTLGVKVVESIKVKSK